jgi:hypothetical protein
MAGEWYYKFMGDITGPMTANELKACAADGRITMDTWVRKGETGQWITADRVKGLLTEEATESTHSENQDSSGKASQKELEAMRVLGIAPVSKGSEVEVGSVQAHPAAATSLLLRAPEIPCWKCRKPHLSTALFCIACESETKLARSLVESRGEKFFYLLAGEERRGPFLIEQILSMWRSGGVTADSMAIMVEQNESIPVKTLAQIASRSVPVNVEPESWRNIVVTFGSLLLFGGLMGLIYFAMFFNTSVEVPTTYIRGFGSVGGESVNNIGLLQTQQNGITICGIATACGLMCVLVGLFAPKRQ